MANGKFSVDMVGDSVLFHPWVKVNFNHVRTVFFKDYLSTGQLNGGSILRVMVVPRGPVFLITSSLVMGRLGTFFSQRYLNSSLEKLKARFGVIKFPKTFEL